MQDVKSIINRGLIGTAAVLFGLLPALTVGVSADTCTPPSAQVGVNRPVGADAGTYTYDCTSGLWQNNYYTFDPNTDITTPTYAIVYTYNSGTGVYDYPDWIFNAPNNSYVEVTQSIAQPPTGADVVGAPVPVTLPSSSDPSSNSITNTGPNSNNTINGTDGGSGSISNTGPNSNNVLGGTNTNNLNATNLSNASLNNLITQNSGTGNSLVIGNTTAGNATSGNSTDIANIVNLLQSATNALGGSAVTFVANINGNVNGDLLIDPSTLGTVQPAASSTPSGTNNITVNNQTNSSINNNIDVGATSGNAAVTNNTTGGSANSGSADAIANVVNLIDSAISSGKSFVGVININGNLNGNIVIPPNLINQLIASNVPTATINVTGPGSNNAINTGTNSSNTAVTNTNNEGINNTINANSTSGQATVSNNTTGGSATSGSAANKITAFNLTGSNVVGSNDLLVFVNVLGTWVGMIINAPAGATAAELGGRITQSSANTNNTTVNNTTNQQINNNINLNAASGNAGVTGNTNGGNATTGNANTAVNLLNVENSNLSLSNWFGILFINVFGTWNGSFGPQNYFADLNYPSTGGAGVNSPAAQAFRFVPNSGSPSTSSSAHPYSNSAGSQTNSISGTGPGSFNVILAAKHSLKNVATTAQIPKLQTTTHRNLLLPILGVTCFVLYVIGERIYAVRYRSIQ
jgi:hypothetical protein